METIKELFKEGIDKIFAITGVVILYLTLFELGKDSRIPIPREMSKIYWAHVAIAVCFLILAIFIRYKDEYLLKKSLVTREDDKDLLSCLYVLSGVKRGIENIRFDTLYQDFNITTGSKIENRNVVHFLWADVRMGNSINAEIIKNAIDSPFLRVSFRDNQCSYQSNISIFPQDKKVAGNYDQSSNSTIKYRYIKINCRIPKEVTQDAAFRISFGLRVLDRNLTYWEYSKKLPINIADWKDVYADIGNHECWSIFNKDGNYFPINKTPDFTIIAGVILIFGFYREDFPDMISGNGVADIKRIWMDNNP